ncbi:MAG: cobalt ECF transporter T component CbiQ, partial [Candidatus Syntropharchaeia archaeon]
MHVILEKSLKEASKYFQNFFIHEYSEKGALHAVDPRVKIFATLILILISVSTFEPQKILFVTLTLIALAKFSKISLKKVFARIWLFSLFSFIITLPLLFQDAFYPFLFTLRVIASLTAIQLLIMTTSFSEICSALRSLRVPKLFVSALWIAYRYILLMFQELISIFMARESRRVSKGSHFDVWRKGGESVGLFFIRSFEKAERVQLAMIARGGDEIAYYRGRAGKVDFI